MLGVLAVWWRARSSGRAPEVASLLVRLFAAWTIGVWAVRAVQIATADHEAAFVAVHTALAVVSTGLAVWAARAVVRTPEAVPA